MKNRGLAFLLCAVMLFSCLPVTPFGEITGLTANAADTESGVDVTELKKLYDSVPKSEWSQYTDTETLEIWYNSAAEILENPDSFSQSYIDKIEASLKNAISGLKYHTKSISLSQTAATAGVDSTVQLTATLNPKNAADPVTWKSSSESIATVNASGLVTVRGYSKNGVVITATSNGHSATCKITTLNPLGGVTLSKTSNTLYESQSFTLTAKAIGKDSSASTTDTVIYTWDSSNSSVASVNDSGKVTAKKAGSTTISVTAKAGSNQYKATCKVTVNKLTEITSIKVNTQLVNGSLPLTVNETTTFKVTVSPADASVKDFKWISSDPKIATVKADKISGAVVTAKITALKAGKTKISYSTTDGSSKSGSFTVEVKPLINFLSISESYKVINPDKTNAKLTATIKPANAGNQVLTWTSSNPDVCDVNYAGVLIPKSNGTTTIIAKTQDGSNLTANCTVRVAEKASSVSLNKTSQSLNVTKTATLTATVKTSDGSKYNNVSWSSSNTKVATVSSSGKITAKYPGTATIRATALDGTGKSATCKVTVTAPVKGVSLTAKKTIDVKQEVTLKPTFNPSYASNKKVTWKSSNTAVATVSSSGVVKPKKVGTATITCTTADGGYKANCVVTVVIKTTSIKLSKASATVAAGKTYSLKATLAPTNATDKTVKWSSSNTKVAKVSSSGVVTAVAGGSCTITAKSSGGQSATCKITVTQKVSTVDLSKTSATLYTSQVYTLKATITPSTATNQNVTWSSSNTKVATVSSKGAVTAIATGSAIITVKTADGGYTSKCTVKVVKKVDVKGISLSSKTLSLAKGKQATLDTTFNPNNASEKGVTWTTSDSSIATVTSKGVVKGVKTGKAVITAKSKDGNFTAKCTVTVTQKATGVKLSASTIKVANGQSKTLTATVSPSDASNKKVTWKSSNTAIAKVNSSGVVTGVKAGTATITATTNDGGYSASCKVTIFNSSSGVTLSANVLKIPKGETKILTATVLPESATNKTVTWKSSDKKVATVNSAGQITALKIGATIITATSKDSGLSADCMVEVVQLATGVSINYTSLTLQAGASKTLTASVKPSTASDKTIKWSSSNKKIATVNSKGKVTAVAAGTATITAKSGDGKALATCRITVKQPVTSLTLSKKTVYIGVNKSYTIKATVKPTNASDKTVKWSTSDKSVVTVTSKGVVKGVKLGKATITATAQSGKVVAKCTVQVVKPVTGIKLNKISVTVNVGKSFTLTPTVSPKDATVKTVKWTSSNTSIATVNSKGKVTTKKPGYAEITATTNDGSFKATCSVNSRRPLKGISFAKTSVTAEVGKTTKLSVTFNPKDATNKTLTWKSSNTSIAKVSSNGTVTGVKKGTAKITATSADGSFKATCTVKVVKKVTSVKLNQTSIVLYLDKRTTLKATVAPSDASNKNVTWTSSSSSIAKVDADGNITPLKTGTTTITVKTADGGKTAKCTVKVEKAAKTIKLNKASLAMIAGNSSTLTATITPSDTTNKKVTWTSSNTSIATVNSSGVVKALKGGTVTITAKTSNGLTAKCTVKITQAVAGIALDKTECTIYAGDKLTLKATVNPTAATNKAVTWSSSDSSVATVSASGVISALKAGTATITVKTADGGKTASCAVTILQHVTAVTIDKTSLTIARGETAELTAAVAPKNATNKEITWSSSNTEVAQVSAAGTVTAIAVGEAVITAKANDNGISAECIVSVYEAATGITLAETEKTMLSGNEITLSATVSPSDATNKAVKWSSGDATIAQVNSAGTVTAIRPGVVTVTATTADGDFKAECVITILQNAESITISENELTLAENEQTTLTAAILPEDAQSKDVIWKSSDESVAKVENGIITAISKGTATITAISAINENVFAECKVEVLRKVTGITLNQTSDSLYIYDSMTQLTATVTPADANNTDVKWSTSDENIATVENGIVSFVNAGTVTITAETVDGGFKAECVLTITQPANQVVFDEAEINLTIGETKQLNATVLPDNTTEKVLMWTSSDSSIVSVSANGEITALAEGTVTITATAAIGGASGTITINVTKPQEPEPPVDPPIEAPEEPSKTEE
ncbi:MAG: Ig-like domain-containing protein [Ruminococcus sp.]|nr:Ig-like domain-containing protein [Ruminococcus sp.]